MKVKKLCALFLVLVLLISLGITACRREEAPEGPDDGKDVVPGQDLAEEQVLRLISSSEPPCLDPQLSTDTTSSEILNDCLEGIIRMDEEGIPKKDSGMATNWDVSEDGLVYTFHLRDAKWTDGEPVSADDFAYAWTRVLDPDTASNYAFLAYPIKNAQAYNAREITDANELGIEVVDEKTLKVTLEKPDPIFVSKLQHSTFFPSRKDLVEKYGDEYALDVGKMEWCGPFKVTEWVHEQSIVMEKNEDYWDADTVKLERVEYTINNDSNTAVNMYETEEVDYLGVPSQFIDKYKDQALMIYQAGTRYMIFNTESEFMKNEKIRQSISRGLDRVLYNETRYKGTRPSAYAFVPPGMPGTPIAKTFREANGNELFTDMQQGGEVKSEINKLFEDGLKELGKTKDGIDNKIEYSTTDSDAALQDAQVYQQMWKENLGIKVGIRQQTWKVHLSSIDNGDFDFGYMGWVGDYNDAMTFLDLFVTGGSFNRGKWSNSEYDALIEKANTTLDERERMQAMLDAEKILIDEMAIAPYSYITRLVIERDYVKGIVRLPLLVSSGKKWAYILEH